MISNGTIRKYVTERIKPYKTNVLGYSLIYSIISGMIGGTIGAALGFVLGLVLILVTMLICILICLIFGIDFNVVDPIIDIVSRAASAVAATVTSVFMSIFVVGFMKEILLCVNNKNKVSPVDFFELGLKDWKKIVLVQLRIFLKQIPGMILGYIGIIVLAIGCLMSGDNVIGIIVSIAAGLLLSMVGFVWALVIALLYQTASYELIYDENNLSPKDILIKARQTIKGHVFQWTRMSWYYPFIFSIILIFFVSIFIALLVGGIGLGAYAVDSAGNGAAGISVLLMTIGILVWGVGVAAFSIAWSLLFQYFIAKNYLNLNELYNAIIKEKSGEVAPM